MSSETINQFVDRWLNDPSFKDRMLTDPDGTVAAEKLSFSEEEWSSIGNVVAGLGGGALTERISKRRFLN